MVGDTLELSREFSDELRPAAEERGVDLPFEASEQEPQSSAGALQGAGIVYRVESGKGTFSLRGNTVEYFAPPINGEEKFFATTTVELAEVVVEQLFHRRFPLNQEALCNISDPGLNWWMEYGDNYLKISFAGHSPQGKLDLGPIGDPAVAPVLLGRLEPWLRRTLPIEEFFVDSKSLALSTQAPAAPVFRELCGLFIMGEEIGKAIKKTLDDGTSALYLEELAAVRRFWLELQDYLSEPPPLLQKRRVTNSSPA